LGTGGRRGSDRQAQAGQNVEATNHQNLGSSILSTRPWSHKFTGLSGIFSESIARVRNNTGGFPVFTRHKSAGGAFEFGGLDAFALIEVGPYSSRELPGPGLEQGRP